MIRNFKFLLGAFLLLSSVAVKAQFLADNLGRPLRNVRYTDISGSPYFNAEFQKGIVKFGSASKEVTVLLQYDQVADMLTYKDKASDEELKEFVNIVSEFTILNAGTGAGALFINIPENGKSVYYQVLQQGKDFSLLTKEIKKIVDVTSYNSANKEKRVSAAVKYYAKVNADGTLKPITLDKKSILDFFKGNEVKVEEFMQKNKYNFKKKDDVISLFAYMNGN
ncbi:hypothetical protein ACQKCH_16670 [Nubsella zeaxanthinifaciens]|uniref:hypothetical protein n=1 Tax=Nubsella zeaxanthinifaciens TaxID=392412 RepID=UPI003D06A773